MLCGISNYNGTCFSSNVQLLHEKPSQVASRICDEALFGFPQHPWID